MDAKDRVEKIKKEIEKFPLSRVIWISIGIILVFLFILALALTGKLLGWLIVFPYLGDIIQEWTGVGYWLSRIISIPLALGFIFFLPWSISRKKSKRTKALIIIAGMGLLFCLGMALIQMDRNFDPSGRPLKCVTEDVWGRKVIISCGNKVHPVSGKKVVPISPALARELAVAQSSPPPVKRIVPNELDRLFTTDGDPLLWYYQYPDGRLEFFAEPGMHPTLNVDLIPINSSIAGRLHQYLADCSYDMIVANDQPSRPLADSPAPKHMNESFDELKKLSQMLKNLRR